MKASMATISDGILLLLSIKEEGTLTGIDHIFEKVRRDVSFIEKKEIGKEEVERAIKDLIYQGLVERFKKGFSLSEEGEKTMEKMILEKDEDLNRSYVKI
ncbi:MAG: hypothetical protein L6N94_06400 [Candidatus Methylarchaceae archaeon HK01M]|nr:hypothetical protein [Candidatus Methylarchaceae archaeon HK01M]